MNQQLELLKNCTDADDLKPLLHSICSSFGEVTRLDVLLASQVGKRQALCFLRMATLEQEQALMRELQIGRFGGDVVVIVDLQPKRADGTEMFALSSRRDAEDPTARRHFQPTLPMASTSVSPMISSVHQTLKPRMPPPRLAGPAVRDVWYG
ncbi:MAG: hypothetical protein V4772_18560 [Pseudomonadota bacterium]